MVIIIGAGINGLALARKLDRRGIDYVLLEAGEQVGGYIRSEKVGDYWLEYGPNSLLCDAETDSILEAIGLKSAIVPASEVSKHRYIFRKGKYRKLPASPPGLLFNGFFSWKTKLAVFSELYKRSEGDENETLSQFFKRRFSQEIVDYPLNTFVAGIYAGDPDKLLVRKTFPVLKDYEKNYGSVLRGAIKNKSGARKRSITFRNGMQQLPRTLANGLNIRLNTPVAQILTEGESYTVQLQNGEELQASQVVLAVPAFVAARLLANSKPAFAALLEKVSYPPMAVVHSVFEKSAVGFPLDGFGGLHPQRENLFTAGSIWSSSVFPGKAPKNQVLLTTFIGGELYRERASFSQKEILKHTTEELQKVYQISQQPIFQRFMRWERAIPQYDHHIVPVHEKAEAEEKNGLWVAANWKDGISIADALRKAPNIADRIHAYAL